MRFPTRFCLINRVTHAHRISHITRAPHYTVPCDAHADANNTQYDFLSVERSMYAWWEEKGYFKPGGDPKKKSYVVPMPPPNVTGYLHMGHAMGTTLQVWVSGVVGWETLATLDARMCV